MAVSLTVYDIHLENWVRSCLRSLKMAPFDGLYTTFYWSAIVSIDLVPFLSYLTLQDIVTLKVSK